MIRGVTFSEQVFRSKDFAHFQNVCLRGTNGITKGCEITNDGANVTIGKGYFFVQGRLLNVEDSEVIESSQFTSGYNRIVYEIDLTKENTVAEFNQGCIKVLTTEALTQEDLDNGGNVYQFPICHFTWNGSAISSFVVDATEVIFFVGYRTAEISNTWTVDSTNGGYYQTIPVEGIKANDNPFVDIVLGTDIDANELYANAWVSITRITTGDGAITLFANEEKPATAFTIQLKVVR